MTIRQLIPEDLAQRAPGPELSALLGGLGISVLTGTDLVEVLRARARQLSHEQAQLLVVMVEVGLCDPKAGADEVARLAQAPECAADEIRAALAWTRNAAYREYHFAETLLTRLPAVFTALDTGAICRSKAWLLTELCAELTDEQTQVVCERLLPDAARLTTGEFAALAVGGGDLVIVYEAPLLVAGWGWPQRADAPGAERPHASGPDTGTASVGISLHFPSVQTVDRPPAPYEQVATCVRSEIQRGRLTSRTRLPLVRRLAQQWSGTSPRRRSGASSSCSEARVGSSPAPAGPPWSRGRCQEVWSGPSGGK